AFNQCLLDLFAQQLRLDRPANQTRAFAENRDRLLLRLRVVEKALLRHARLMPERLQLPGIDAVAFALQLLLQEAGERKIHIVAAEQDVIADGDAPQRQIAVLLRDRDQAEVGRPAADIADQDQVADLDALAPVIALTL